MSKLFNRALQLCGEIRKVGTPTNVTVLEYDVEGMVRRAEGATVPTDADAGYAKGCIFVDTDASAGSVFYVNEGSDTSCDFNVAAGEASAATAWDDVTDPDANSSVSFGTYTNTFTSSGAAWAGNIFSNTHSNPTAGANLLSLNYIYHGIIRS